MRSAPSSPTAPQARRDGAIGDDNAEFELPAIFKPGHHQAQNERPNNLFGRLSDALKPTAPAEQDRARTVIRFEPASGRMIEPPPPLRHPMQQSAEAVQAASSAGGLEDAAAQLLRPILKQWLTENMPKIVEKALRSEAGEEFPQPGTGPGGRKPGQ